MEDKFLFINTLAKELNKYDAKVYFVGGYVRDKILFGEDFKFEDFDIEIHNIEIEKFLEIGKKFGNIIHYGKSFGIYSFEGLNIDIAFPRKEKKIGEKHTDFIVEVDPFLGEYEASKRRDFTINSIMINALSGEIIDNFGGISDIKNKRIRHIDDKSFIEDNLRIFRACQFASRFNFDISKETLRLCGKINIENISKERVFNELQKALLKSDKPSIFFRKLDEMGHLNIWFKELKELQKIPQNPLYHKEGNVFEHTMMVLDQAAKLRSKVTNQMYFMLSALCHDLGKLDSTLEIDGKIKSLGHEITGIDISERFLKRITNENKLIKYVKNMVFLHMRPNMMARDNSKIKSTNKMFDESIDPEALIYLSVADDKGRISEVEKEETIDFLFDRLEIYNDTMKKDYITGNDLIIAGFAPGENFNKALKFSHKLRLSGVDKKSNLSQTIKYIQSLLKDDKTNKKER